MGALLPPVLGTTRELSLYYEKRFQFDRVEFIAAGSTGSIWPEDQYGKIILTRGGVTKTITVNDVMWQQGYDGIEDVLTQADMNWDHKWIFNRDPGDETDYGK